MRLTLRTLLAYLDNTLDEQDAQALRAKLEQSGYATQVVQRIRAVLAANNLSAPAPDSVHPIEEPNMMSEYLDSTYLDSPLSPEQITEIEKACLESEPHLAEAAACHQILTMVLGQPAKVSDQLRDRICAMVGPDGKVAPGIGGTRFAAGGEEAVGAIAGEIGPRYSDIQMDQDAAGPSPPLPEPPEADFGDGVSDAEPTYPPRDSQAETLDSGRRRMGPPAPPVQPVGVDDSGVFQAATKLRGQSDPFAEPSAGLEDAAPLAGSRPMSELRRSDFYEGDVRPSRITPWLVSLALVGALLFAISQIFAPLMNDDRVAQKDDSKVSQTYPDVETQTDLPENDSGGKASTDVDGGQDLSDADMVAEEAETGSQASEADQATGEEPESDGTAEPSRETGADPGQPEKEQPDTADASQPTATDSIPEPDSDVAMEDSGNERSESAAPGDQEVTYEAPPVPPGAGTPDAEVAMTPKAETEPAEGLAEPPTEEQPLSVVGAVLASEDALVAKQVDEDTWQLLANEDAIQPGDVLVCAPEYRARLSASSTKPVMVTLVGPTRIGWAPMPETAAFDVVFGKGLVAMVEAGQTVSIGFADQTWLIRSASDNATVAFHLVQTRELGTDPRVPENHRNEMRFIATTGDVQIETSDGTTDLKTREQLAFQVRADELTASEPVMLDQMPSWVDPETDTGTLESEAATDLLSLVRQDDAKSLLLSLRVALDFRRNEVAALAGKTMLALGDASAYFGVDGLLSNPKQRLYWSSHLDALRKTIGRSADDALAVRRAIAGENEAMDNADGDTLFRLLMGYSQDQLKTGGDAELVADLESASMPVRVLASENLRDISGTTLFFRPEEAVSSRRDEVVKKWKVRLNKESIRWPDPAVAPPDEE
ncbi:hypothetical protein FYK55_22815 [Roseiconus nitratireducens]|uniref:Uncharacterized protein n=1 Tax=Roseiconus nitratireducens TaxID=2605748 RepID=A0A5M6CXD0_9BACT|nr:hypothetical protein [Roseiconus nitratireducens]KAA5539884.1 hypothetical protein FYK55_22815 [Roseiconus nitratireducens]